MASCRIEYRSVIAGVSVRRVLIIKESHMENLRVMGLCCIVIGRCDPAFVKTTECAYVRKFKNLKI